MIFHMIACTGMAESAYVGDFSSDDADQYPLEPIEILDYFDPLFFDPIISWEYDMVRSLVDEGDGEELEWLLRLFTACEPYPVEGVIPLDAAYPFRQTHYSDMVSHLMDPQADIYEYDDEYYIGPEACYGFTDGDFICLDDDWGVGLPLGLRNILFPPANNA